MNDLQAELTKRDLEAAYAEQDLTNRHEKVVCGLRSQLSQRELDFSPVQKPVSTVHAQTNPEQNETIAKKIQE